MKILIRQFLGKNHSWGFVGQGIARALNSLGHDVHLFSTDGTQHLPGDLRANLIGYTEENNPTKVFGKLPDHLYDCQISYTAMKNFPVYLSNGNKNRLGIWAWEWCGKNSLPIGFAKQYKYCDALCAPSSFAKDVFIQSGVPEGVIKVIPHGINVLEYSQNSKIDLPTKKKFKILTNIAQNHLRKNIPGLLDAYGKAFTNEDDVCLILKAKEKPVKFPFDVSLNDCIRKFKQNYPKHAEIKVMSDFIEDLSSLYRSVDTLYTMTHCEAFYMPSLEILASGKLVISPNWGGQLDFLNKSNSLLIDGKQEKANPKSMYWSGGSGGGSTNAIWFNPSVDDAAEKLKFAYKNYETLNKVVESDRHAILQKYSWENVASQFLDLCI